MIDDEYTYGRAEALQWVKECLTGVCEHVKPPRPEGPVPEAEVFDLHLEHSMSLADAEAALRRCAPPKSKARYVLLHYPQSEAEARLRSNVEDLLICCMNGDLRGIDPD